MIGTWIGAIAFTAFGLVFLLIFWRPKDSDDWITLAAFKAGSLVALSIGYILLQSAVHAHWPVLGEQIAWTIILAPFVAGFLCLGWYTVSSRRDLKALARAPLSTTIEAIGENAVENAFSEGPPDALKTAAAGVVEVGILRLPLGWLVLALLPAVVAVVLVFGICELWVTGPVAAGTTSDTHGGVNVPALFEHVAYYTFFGGMLVGGLAMGLMHWIDKEHTDSDWLLCVAAAAVFLVPYMLFEGVWA